MTQNNTTQNSLSLSSLGRILTLLLMACFLGGCGASAKVEELSAYEDSMHEFCNALSACGEQMKEIDPESTDAPATLLNLLDQMVVVCQDAAKQEVPQDFEEAGTLCQDAALYMEQARDGYYSAFQSEPFDETAYEEASLAYEKANDYIQDMLDVLHE